MGRIKWCTFLKICQCNFASFQSENLETIRKLEFFAFGQKSGYNLVCDHVPDWKFTDVMLIGHQLDGLVSIHHQPGHDVGYEHGGDESSHFMSSQIFWDMSS